MGTSSRPQERDAFDDTHPSPRDDTRGDIVTGRITQVIRSRACGFIRAANGQDVFFHASDLHGATLDQLEDCLTVRFDLIHDSVSGPRATRVRLGRRGASNGSAAPKDPRRVSNSTNEPS